MTRQRPVIKQLVGLVKWLEDIDEIERDGRFLRFIEPFAERRKSNKKTRSYDKSSVVSVIFVIAIISYIPIIFYFKSNQTIYTTEGVVNNIKYVRGSHNHNSTIVYFSDGRVVPFRGYLPLTIGKRNRIYKSGHTQQVVLVKILKGSQPSRVVKE